MNSKAPRLRFINQVHYKLLTYQIIQKSGLRIHLQTNIKKLKESVLAKNKQSFEEIKEIIQNYLYSHQNKSEPKFNELTLWQIADTKLSKQKIETIIKNDSKLLKLFADTNDIIHIFKRCKSIQVLEIFLNFSKLNTLIQKLQSKGLVRIASHHGSIHVLNLILDTKIGELLLNRLGREGLIQIGNNDGALQVLNMILDDEVYKILIEHLGEEMLIKIGSISGSKQVLELLLNKKKFNYLIELIGKENLLKIACNLGARQVFDIFLNKKKFNTLLVRLGKKNIIEIANNDGARQVFNMIIETETFESLVNLLGEKEFFKIARIHSARQIFKLLLKKDSLELPTECSNIDTLIKIAKQGGSNGVLNLILNKKTYEPLKERLSEEGIIKIASRGGAKNVFELILDDDVYQTLIKLLTKDELIDITKQGSSRELLNMLLDKEKVDLLIERIGKEAFMKIAKKSGAKNVFNIILKTKTYETLLEYLGIEGLIKVSNHNGSRQVLELISKKENFVILLKRLGKPGIINIGSHDGAIQVFNLILDEKTFNTLKKRIGSENLIKICGHIGAKPIIETLLDKKKYETLLEYIGKENLIKISGNIGGKQVLDLFLKKEVFETLRKKIGEENLIKILNHNGSKPILDLILDKEKLDCVLKRIEETTFFKIASYDGGKRIIDMILDDKTFNLLSERIGKKMLTQIITYPNIASQLKVILDTKKWKIINEVIDNDTLLKILSQKKLKQSLVNMITNYETLKKWLTKKSLYKYTLLSTKDQTGLQEGYLKKLLSEFNFREEEILVLAKIAGRFIPYILNLCQNHESDIRELFEEKNSLPILPPITQTTSSYKTKKNLNHLTEKEYWIISLVELNQYCKNEALSLEELHNLKKVYAAIKTNRSLNTNLKNLIKITGSYSSEERIKIWKALNTNESQISYHWINNLNSLAPYLRKWFIKTGIKYIDSFFSSTQLTVQSKPDLNQSKIQEFLMHCMQDAKTRTHISKKYEKKLQTTTRTFHNLMISEKASNQSIISKNSAPTLQPFDWMKITLYIYNLIDAEYDILECLGNKEFDLESNYLNSTQVHKLKANYPNIILKNGSIIVDIENQLLSNMLPSQSNDTNELENSQSLYNTSRKRHASSPTPHISKRRIMNAVNILSSLRDLSTPVSEWTWHSIETYIRSSDKNLTKKIHQAIQLRLEDNIPETIKALLPSPPQTTPLSINTEEKKDLDRNLWTSDFLSLLELSDWKQLINEKISINSENDSELTEASNEAFMNWINEWTPDLNPPQNDKLT